MCDFTSHEYVIKVTTCSSCMLLLKECSYYHQMEDVGEQATLVTTCSLPNLEPLSSLASGGTTTPFTN